MIENSFNHSLRYYDAKQVESCLVYPELIQALTEVFQQPAEAPVRQQHQLNNKGINSSELLVMPAWTNQAISVKLVTISPENRVQGLQTISGLIVLFDRQTGVPIAVLDAGEVTARRTAAASALASSFLSREDAQRLLIVGNGRLVSYLAEAHAQVRNLSHISIWGRDSQKAELVLATLPERVLQHCDVSVVSDLQAAAAEADIISMATRSTVPLIKAAYLPAGVHLDLVGGYRPDMREVDDACMKTAMLFADTREGVLAEAGDIIQPIEAGLITPSDIQADLYDLCRGQHKGRSGADEITLFKSVGSALEDLAAATLVVSAKS